MNEILKCNAKINLSLKIKGTDDKGYHILDSIFLPIELSDEIEVKPLSLNENSIVLINDKVCSFPNNICLKIIEFFESNYKINDKFSFNIKKKIPSGAGLGGGSSDGVAIFKFYMEKYKIKFFDEEVCEIMKNFGADLPFFYFNEPSRVGGIGEIIKPFKLNINYFVLIVYPNVEISTKEIFNLYDELNDEVNIDIDKIQENLKKGNVDELNRLLGNSLENAAFLKNPTVKELKEELISLGLKNVLMTGSGSSIFSIDTNIVQLSLVHQKMMEKGYLSFLTCVKC